MIKIRAFGLLSTACVFLAACSPTPPAPAPTNRTTGVDKCSPDVGNCIERYSDGEAK